MRARTLIDGGFGVRHIESDIGDTLGSQQGRLAAAVLGGFVINRTVGMPNATDDIGNWLEPLGVLSIVAELFVIGMGIAAAFTVRSSSRTTVDAQEFEAFENAYASS